VIPKESRTGFRDFVKRNLSETRSSILVPSKVDQESERLIHERIRAPEAANEVEEVLRENQQHLASIYNSVRDVIFQVAVEPQGKFRFVSVNAAFLRVTGLSRETVVGKTVNDVIPEPSLAMVLGKYRQAIEEQTTVVWEETSDYPTGRLTGEVSIVPVFDDNGTCTHLVGSLHDITERKQAEAMLRESEERFRNMVDSTPVMIWATDTNKRGTFFNKCCLDFTGHTMQDKLGDGWVASLHPDDREQFLNVFSSSIDAREEFRSLFRLRRADGEYRWMLTIGVPCFATGVFSGYIGSWVDITDRKLIEEQLRASETQLKDAQRLTRVGSWERHIDTDRIYWSDENRRIFGVPADAPSDLAGFVNRVHPKDREKILEVDRRLRSSSAPIEVEYRIIRPDGEVRFVRTIVEPVRNDLGALVRLAGATQDITEQVRAQDLLRQSQERLKNAERLSHLGHWDWDLKSNQIIWSEECFRIFGQPQDYTPSYEDFLHQVVPQDKELIDRVTKESLAANRGASGEFQISRPNGDLRTVRLISELMLDEDGTPIRLFGTIQDITDAKRAQEVAFARQNLESVGALASGIAHDFNNLLAGVLAQAELALEERATGIYPEEELKSIRQLAIRGSEIVRELMIYAGQDREIPGLVNVSELVQEMLALLKVSISKHAMLKIDLEKQLPTVGANAAQISQILMNLVANASEAIGDRDGTIQVTTRRVTIGPDSPRLDHRAEGEYVQLEVSDTGIGMSPETRVRVFDPFFSTKSAGRGLGLAVVHGIVRDLGGTIHLASELGRGTSFLILLPSAEATSAAIRRPILDIGQPDRPFQSATILIVEDEDPLRQAASKILQKDGFSVIEAADGSTALDAIRALGNPIDVLFLDVTLPGIPGRVVLEEASRLRPQMRVVVTSAYSEEMAAASLQTTIKRFIRKPYRLNDLVGFFQPNPS
jgi:two-component system, cell cycle sensor histidine kinase and response regulator CckA